MLIWFPEFSHDLSCKHTSTWAFLLYMCYHSLICVCLDSIRLTKCRPVLFLDMMLINRVVRTTSVYASKRWETFWLIKTFMRHWKNLKSMGKKDEEWKRMLERAASTISQSFWMVWGLVCTILKILPRCGRHWPSTIREHTNEESFVEAKAIWAMNDGRYQIVCARIDHFQSLCVEL